MKAPRFTLRNETAYNATDLKRLVRRVAVDEVPATARPFTVRVRYQRAGSSTTGYAWEWSRRVVLLMYRDGNQDLRWFAQTIAHELAHLRGVHHRAMRGTRYTGVLHLDQFDWARDFPLRHQPKVPAKVDPRVQQELALAHARTMLAKADTRLKRAHTIRTKWNRTVNRLERKAAHTTKGE